MVERFGVIAGIRFFALCGRRIFVNHENFAPIAGMPREYSILRVITTGSYGMIFDLMNNLNIKLK